MAAPTITASLLQPAPRGPNGGFSRRLRRAGTGRIPLRIAEQRENEPPPIPSERHGAETDRPRTDRPKTCLAKTDLPKAAPNAGDPSGSRPVEATEGEWSLRQM